MNVIINNNITITKIVSSVRIKKTVNLLPVDGNYFVYNLKIKDINTNNYVLVEQKISTTGDELITPIKDGLYLIEISIPNVENNIEFSFYLFNKLRKDIIENVQTLLCNKCKNCDPCFKGLCDKYQRLFANITIYTNYLRGLFEDNEFTLNTSIQRFVQASMDLDYNNVINNYTADLLQTSMTGNSITNINRLKYNLSLLYLGMYFYERNGVSLLNQSIVKLEYNYNKIISCICLPNNVEVYSNLFNTLNTIEEEPLPFPPSQSVVNIWQANLTELMSTDIITRYQDDPIDFINNSTVVNTLDSFTNTAQPINLTNIGRLAFIVRELANVEDLTLSILDGSDTILNSDFDFYTDEVNSNILAVSKMVLSYGTLYFKLDVKVN
jgi:hypothetical protein